MLSERGFVSGSLETFLFPALLQSWGTFRRLRGAAPPQIHAQIHTATIHHLPAQELVSPENPLHQRWSRTYNRCILLSPPLAGELAFGRGDNIRVVCRGYKDWWRGQLRERCGIFPVNYVVSNRTSYRLDVFGFDHWINHRFRNQLRLS